MQNFINSMIKNERIRILRLSFVLLATFFCFTNCFGVIPESTKIDTKICLCMIVKNESKIITRCLDSVKNILDYVSIVDTGSNDGTPAIIQQYLDANNIPGTIHNQEWKNFGHNRTLSAKAAQEALKKDGFSLENTYLLFLDADMILKVEPEFNKADLKDDSYLMIQKDWVTTYYNLRLGKACFDWKSIGVTHEYWAADRASTQGKIQPLWIDDKHDGGCKSDKFERDIRLLTQGLIDEPNNARYMFYLAQSYQNTQQWDKAIEWYHHRIAQGGWYEEVWISKYLIGQCYEGKGDWDNALKYYLEAFQYHPQRAEPLSSIASYYLSKGKNDLACIFSNYGKNIKYPDNDVLLIEQDVYNHKLLQNLSIGYFYTQFRSKGLKCLDRLLLRKNVPDHIRQNCRNNLLHYVENLKNAQFINIEPEKLSTINTWSPDKYLPTNPCILKTRNGYKLNCRTVNYHQKYPTYLALSDDGFFKTKNVLIEYDSNLNKISESQVIDHPNLMKFVTAHQGIEDIRLFELNNELYFTATCCQLNSRDFPQLCLGKYNDFKNGYMLIDKLTLLKGPNPDRVEKNWMPFAVDNELYVIYSYSPFIVYKPNLETGECVTVINKNYNADMGHFRGSAAPIPFDDGYLMAVHEVIWLDRGYYIHRFIYLDKNLEIKKLSRPFTFKHKGVEFCAGMAFDNVKNDLLLSIGIEDREAVLCAVNADYVRSLLQNIS